MIAFWVIGPLPFAKVARCFRPATITPYQTMFSFICLGANAWQQWQQCSTFEMSLCRGSFGAPNHNPLGLSVI